MEVTNKLPTFELCSKLLSLENEKKNKLFFFILLAYS